MPRPNLIRCDNNPYHVTSRCQAKEFFPLPLNKMWELMVNNLKTAHDEHGLAIHAFVLMGNHFHLLCHTPRSNLDQAIQALLKLTSTQITRLASSPPGLWEGRYKWSMINSHTHYYHVYRYIFQNPLRANLVDKVEDYPFSTLKMEVPFPLHSFVPLSFGGHEGEIRWLNERFTEEDRQTIKLGLKQSQFDINQRQLKAFSTRCCVPVKDHSDKSH